LRALACPLYLDPPICQTASSEPSCLCFLPARGPLPPPPLVSLTWPTRLPQACIALPFLRIIKVDFLPSPPPCHEVLYFSFHRVRRRDPQLSAFFSLEIPAKRVFPPLLFHTRRDSPSLQHLQNAPFLFSSLNVIKRRSPCPPFSLRTSSRKQSNPFFILSNSPPLLFGVVLRGL